MIVHHPFWYTGVMLGRCGEMLKYSAHAPLVFTINQARSAQRTAPAKRGWETLASDESQVRVGSSIDWLRLIVRPLQRITKETMLLFIIIGVVVLSGLSWKRSLLLLTLPLYYFVFQSAMHTEFRYTLPMQYFMFVFAGVVWVLIGAGISKGIARVSPSST